MFTLPALLNRKLPKFVVSPTLSPIVIDVPENDAWPVTAIVVAAWSVRVPALTETSRSPVTEAEPPRVIEFVASIRTSPGAEKVANTEALASPVISTTRPLPSGELKGAVEKLPFQVKVPAFPLTSIRCRSAKRPVNSLVANTPSVSTVKFAPTLLKVAWLLTSAS